MSGIAGIFHLNSRPVSMEELQLMAETLARRGPDGIFYFSWKAVGFVQFKLCDTPESILEGGPNRINNDPFVLTFHGRLDNRKELHQKIGVSKPLNETTDSDLILSAYRKWRKSCVNYFLGDFAFVIWDQLESKVFCARDHMGVIPLYYYLSENHFIFGSEIKALLALPEVPCLINNERVADYFTCIVSDNESTFYKNIFRLPPGHTLEVSSWKSTLTRYHEFSAMALHCKNNAEYEEQFCEIFTEAVRVRLRSAFSVGAYLSGGLDSSSIVCTAAGVWNNEFSGKLHTFSGIFDDVSSCDERDYFMEVIERYNLQPHTLLTDKINPALSYEKLMQDEDEPFVAPHVFMSMGLLPLARRSGVRIMLDGHDGDAAVSYGYSIFQEYAMTGNLFRLVESYRDFGVGSIRLLIKNISRLYWNVICSRIPVSWPFSPRLKNIRETVNKLNHDFARSIGVTTRLVGSADALPRFGQKEREYHLKNITQPVQPVALELFDRLTVNNGIVARYPYFDKRVIEFCLALPTSQKFQNGLNRSIVRRALNNLIPKNILERKNKTDFSPSFINAFLGYDKGWLIDNIDIIGKENYDVLSESFCRASLDRYKHREVSCRQIALRDLLSFVLFFRWRKKVFGANYS